MGLADTSVAQEADAVPWLSHDDDVLVAVDFLLPTVVQGLFFRVFRPLTTPFRAVDDEQWLGFRRGLALGKMTAIPLWANAEIVQGLLQSRQQSMNPIGHLRLAQIKEFAHDSFS